MSLTRFERAVLRDLPALIRKNDSLVDAIIARLRGLGNGGRGPQSDGRGLITGQFGPFTDEFDDGALESMWTWLSTPQSYSEGDGTLSVDFSDHQGDHLPLGTWEFL